MTPAQPVTSPPPSYGSINTSTTAPSSAIPAFANPMPQFGASPYQPVPPFGNPQFGTTQQSYTPYYSTQPNPPSPMTGLSPPVPHNSPYSHFVSSSSPAYSPVTSPQFPTTHLPNTTPPPYAPSVQPRPPAYLSTSNRALLSFFATNMTTIGMKYLSPAII